MSGHDRKQKNNEAGFRQLFVETLPPTPAAPVRQVVEIMTIEEIHRRFLALPLGILASRRLHEAIMNLAMDVARSHAALADFSISIEQRRETVLQMIALSQQVDPTDVNRKAWVLDQIARILAGDRYDELVATACAGPAGPETYPWDVGIEP